MMEYIVITTSNDAYANTKYYNYFTLDAYIKSLSDLRIRKEHYYCVSSLLTPPTKKWWFRSYVNNNHKADLHCLLLDCDTELGMYIACKTLEEDGIGVATISSTIWKNVRKYWVIGDIALPLKDVLRKMTTIPGVDEKFTKLCHLSQKIVLRGLPRVNDEGKLLVPTFNTHSLKNPLVITWHKEYEALFSNPAIQKGVKRRWLEEKYQSGELDKYIADPNFTFDLLS